MTNELIIIITCFALYIRSIQFQPVVDEITRYNKNLTLNRSPISWLDSFCYAGGFIKTLWLDRLITITLYTTVCVFIYWAFGSNTISLMTALLYCVNPINHQIAIWNNGRRYLFVIIIVLGMLIKKWALLFYIFIPYLQLTGILAPLLIFHNAVIVGITILFIVIITINNNVLGQFKDRFKRINKNEKTKLHLRKLILFIKTIGFYFWNTILPTNKFMYYSYLQNFGITKEGNKEAYSLNRYFYISIITIITLIISTIYYRGTPISYGIIWWFIFIFQWSNLITITQNFADRYCSLPAIFIMYALAYLIHGNMIAFSVIFTSYIFATINTMKQYENGDVFLEYHFFYQPDNIESRQALAINLIRNKDYIRALSVSKEGLRYYPNDFRLNVLVANCLRVLNPKEVKHYIDIAEKNVYLGDEKNATIILNNLRNLGTARA